MRDRSAMISLSAAHDLVTKNRITPMLWPPLTSGTAQLATTPAWWLDSRHGRPCSELRISSLTLAIEFETLFRKRPCRRVVRIDRKSRLPDRAHVDDLASAD